MFITFTKKNNMQFDYIQYLWSSYHESELHDIINGGGLEADKQKAKAELHRREQEQSEFLEL